MAQASKDATFLSESTNSSHDQILTLNNNGGKNSRDKSYVRCYNCNAFGHFARECHNAQNSLQCSSCGRNNHTTQDCYKNRKCSICAKFGHTANFCRRKQSPKYQSHDKSHGRTTRPTNDDSTDEQVLLLGKEVSKGGLKYVDVSFGDGEGSFLIDTGASFSVISSALVKRFNLQNCLSECNFVGITADKSNIQVTKCYKCSLTVGGKSFGAMLFVVDTHVEGILGMDLLPLIGLHIGPESGIIFTLVSDLLRQYADVFNKPLKQSSLAGVEPFEIIKLHVNAVPKQSSTLRFSKAHQDFLNDHIAYLLDQDVIEVSRSPWRHNPLIVSKSDGSYRMTINFKPLNSVTSFDAYPFPNVEELLGKLSGATHFSRIDFSQFYYQLPLLETDREKTVFQACGKIIPI